ncbi:hypothetical protein SAMN04487820_103211 [Actinopolyspora mzabensis]|uniref:Uncharacterized protein n=1 Tax=Actinopolyspora mzabensis TaxID=995066 RepID=A0A1G8Y2L1_ACTMZ|nr:hypothetical protein [Actinopolyspora mzabensis]SDJ96927.1 hypothetical protein SAMN04487820_103211 [Actinopolyspora mzabensis]
MTLQDDRARTWFQPMVPTEQPHRDAVGDAGPLTTRIEGELVFPEQPPTPAPWAERLEVTQPFIPAIRDQTPEFAKRLTAEPVAAAPHPPDDSPTLGTAPAGEPQSSAPGEPTQSSGSSSGSAAAQPQKRRSLARRVVRRILGPDLLRKDPAPKKR